MTLENEAASAAPNEVSMPEAAPAPAPVEQAAPDEAPAEPSIDDTLREVFRKNNPERDESGRFRSREPNAEAAEAETQVQEDQSPTEEPEQALKPAIQPPQSWSADAKAKWATLPPDIQEFVSKRESEAHQTITRQGQELKAYEPLRTVVEQNRDIFERNGVTADDGISRLIHAERMLETDPYSAIATLAQAYGVDLGRFGQGQQPAGNAPPEVSALHQRIAWLESQLNETSNRIAERERAEASTQMQSMQSLIEKFSADKSDWADLETDVLAELVGINAAIQNGIIQPMTADAKLQKAYDRALRNNPEAWNRKQEAERKAAEAKRVEEARKRVEEAKRAKSVNTSSMPTKGGKVITSMDDTLRDAYRKAQSAS